MLDQADPLVSFKLAMLQRVLPSEHVVVFGDMYIVEGGYTEYAVRNGAERATLIDALETRHWLESRIANPALDFYKGDFADPLFMKSVRGTYDTGVAFDVLLHQVPLLSTLHLMLELVDDAFVVVQPMLAEGPVPNTLVFLPGNDDLSLHPLTAPDDEYKAFSLEELNQSHWIWGLTRSFLRCALKGEGFEVVHEETLSQLPNPQWSWWGCVAKRRSRLSAHHWSRALPTGGLYDGGWGKSPDA